MRYAIVVLTLAIGGPATALEALRGRVLDAFEQPVDRVELQWFEANGDVSLGRTVTDADGRFMLSRVSDRETLLLARKTGYDPKARLLPPDARGPVIVRLDATLPRVSADVLVTGERRRRSASSATVTVDERVAGSTSDVLRRVPGLVIARHGGGGKSDQYLLRGFDADHGTDVAIDLEGIPVNVVSHAHGQGYADLGFVISETLAAVDVDKGPYAAARGNFATAGALTFRLRERFERPFVSVQAGAFGSRRIAAGSSPRLGATDGWLAFEHQSTDGPFDDPQDFRRWTAAARLDFDVRSGQTVSLFASAHARTWSASGQIPLREVAAGRLSRFGAIDPSEGGETSRFDVSLSHETLGTRRVVRSRLFATRYHLDLFSNFTFAANDPVRGDGIRQRDDRSIIGGQVELFETRAFGGREVTLGTGVSVRHDRGDVALDRQRARQSFQRLVGSRLRETNVGGFADVSLDVSPRVRANVGVRYDHLWFDVGETIDDRVSGRTAVDFVGLKTSWSYVPHEGASLFASYGRGFHSNDARSAVAEPGARAIAIADGYELGYRHVAFSDRFHLGLAYWWLDSAGELVWVGDEGTTELRGATRRHGPELDVSWAVSDRWSVTASVVHSTGRFRESGDAIPRAPRLVLQSEALWAVLGGPTASLRMRHVSGHPIVEDRSVDADGYTVLDIDARYPLTDRLDFVLAVRNVLDAEVKEAQTYFSSRLPDEIVAVPDNHFTPGVPFSYRVGLEIRF